MLFDNCSFLKFKNSRVKKWIDNFYIQEIDDAQMESDGNYEDEISKTEVEQVQLSKSIDEEALLIWTRI